MHPFDVNDRPWNAHRVLTVAGELDLLTAPELRSAAAAAIAAAPAGIIIDVGRLTFVDACGLGVLAVAAARSGHLPDRLHLAFPDPRLRHLLALTGLTAHLPVHPTYREDGRPRHG